MRPDQFMSPTVQELNYLEVNGLRLFDSYRRQFVNKKLRILFDSSDTRICNPLKRVKCMPNIFACVECMHPGCRWAWLTTTYYGLHFFHFDGEDPVNYSIVDAYKEEFLKKHKFRATLMERCSDDALSYM
eukprot:Nk52_evm1s1322 gene=Nk52_evmTU1s1322